jgi:hypothetical protein
LTSEVAETAFDAVEVIREFPLETVQSLDQTVYKSCEIRRA